MRIPSARWSGQLCMSEGLLQGSAANDGLWAATHSDDEVVVDVQRKVEHLKTQLERQTGTSQSKSARGSRFV